MTGQLNIWRKHIKVKNSIETEEGTIQFEGEISSEELDLILSVGLNYLYQQGAIPFKITKGDQMAKYAEGSESQQ